MSADVPMAAPWDRRLWCPRRANWSLVIGGTAIATLLLSAALAPSIAPHPPTQIFAGQELRPPALRFPWGTDSLGRDILSRTLYGGRSSMGAVAPAVLASGVAGVGIGVVAGYRGGLTDLLLMRCFDILLAFPSFLLALALVAVFGPTALGLVIALALPSVPQFALLSRSTILATKSQEYVTVARALGATAGRIMWRHLLPNVAAPLIVQGALSLSVALLVEASLSFLGLGVQPPRPSWGGMLNSAQEYLTLAPWLLLAPGAALTVAVLGFNLVSDGLREVFDPRLRAQ